MMRPRLFLKACKAWKSQRATPEIRRYHMKNTNSQQMNCCPNRCARGPRNTNEKGNASKLVRMETLAKTKYPPKNAIHRKTLCSAGAGVAFEETAVFIAPLQP